MLDEDDAPPGPLEAAEPPPLMPPLLDAAPPLPELLVPPVPEELSPDELELDAPGELGALDDEEDDPPGTTTVSFSFVVVLEVEGLELPPGTTVVVSLRSQADSARAPIRTNR